MAETDNLIYYGDAVKVLGDGRVGGYLVRYSDADTPDLEGDYFTPETNLGIEDDTKLPVYYQHGLDPVLKARRIGRTTAMKLDDVGVWVEAQLALRDDYERSLIELAEAGKLGWSSQAIGTLVMREPKGKSWHIKNWVVVEASLTPTPAEPRNTAIPVKSLINKPEQDEPEPVTSSKEDNIMTDQVKDAEVKNVPSFDIDSLMEEFDKRTQKAVDDAVSRAVKKAQEPQIKAGAQVEVVEDEADKALRTNPFTGAEFFKAVYMAEQYPGSMDKRLKPLKAASGANESVPSEGGFLVTPDIAAGIMENTWGIGKVLSLIKPTTVSGNGLTVHAIDETSRAAGSRMGGVRGYWVEEAAEKTSSKPSFRDIDLKLKKVIALVYATDELLQDATALESWIGNNVPDELRFMVEDAFIDGTGIGMPLGMLRAGCLISSTRENASNVTDNDISGMWAHRYLGVNDYVWFVNASVMPELFEMTVGNFPVYMPPGGMSQSPYGTLFGRPVIETEYNPYLGTLGDILLASPSQYLAITKGGVQSASSIHVRFVYDETAFRFVYRVDGQPGWASEVTAFDGTNTISPFVALAATT